MANTATDLANLAILTANSAATLAQAAFNAANTSNVAPGDNQSVVFNDHNSYGSSNHFSFNKDSNTLTISNLEVSPGSLNVATTITAGGDIKPHGQGQDLGRITSRWYNVYVDGGIYASGSFGKQGQVLTSDGFGTINWVDPVTSANGAGSQVDTYTRNLVNTTNIVANTALVLARQANSVAQQALTLSSNYSGANGGPVVAGQTQWIQYNDNGAFGASPDFTYNQNAATLYAKNLNVGPGQLNVASHIYTGGDVLPYTQGLNLGSTGNRFYSIYMDGGIYAGGTFGGANQVLVSADYGTVKWKNIGELIANASNFTVPVTDNVARQLISSNILQLNTAITLAQGAYDVANSALNRSLPVDDYSRTTANAALDLAHSSFDQSNSAYSIVTILQDRLNSQNTIVLNAAAQAQNAYQQSLGSAAAYRASNASGVLAQAAFNQANSAYALASSIGYQSQSAFNQANAIGAYAQAAFRAANTAASGGVVDLGSNPYIQNIYNQSNTGSAIAQAAFTKANTALENAVYSQGVNAAQNTSISATNTFAQAAFEKANTISAVSLYTQGVDSQQNTNITATNTLAASAYDQANTGTTRAQAAFNSSNAAIAMIAGIDNTQNTNITTATTLAQAAFNSSNAAVTMIAGIDNAQNTNITATNTFAGSAYGQANTGTTLAQAAFSSSNAATTMIAGIDATQNTNIAATNTLASGAYGQANTGTTLAQAAFNAANTVSATAAYTQGVSATQNTNIAATNTLASGAYSQANTGTTLAQASFDKANTISASVTYTQGVDTTQNNNITATNTLAAGAYTQANTGVTLAQASFDKANTILANDIYLQNVINSQNTTIQNIASTLSGNFAPNLYTTAVSNSVNSIALGGAPVQNAQIWGTYTITQVLDTLLFPTINPTYTTPSISLSANYSGTYEIGVGINQSLTLTGNKNDAGAFTQLRIARNGTNLITNSSPTTTSIGNIGSQYGYNDPNNPNYSYTATYTDTYIIPSGTTTWSGSGSYGAGLAKQNNKGATDTTSFAIRSSSAPQSADSNFGSNSVSITGIYPYFWGVSSTQPTAASIASSIQAGTANKVLAVGSGTLTITYNASSQFVWFAVQSSYGNKSTWYNTALNNGSIGTGQFILSPVSQSVTSPSGYWSGVTYNIYISGYATTTSGTLQFS